MTKLIRNNQKGFTLIELMIVVAIIGILAAIAIPNFLNYQLKSKTAEAKTNIGAIRTSQESYKAETGTFLACTLSPNGGGGPGKTDWAAVAAGGVSFDDIGYSPSGPVFYQYEVDIDDDTANMAIGALADLDGDGTKGSEFGLSTDSGELATTTSLTGGFSIDGQIEDLNPGQY